jgi:nucleoside phosphorylase
VRVLLICPVPLEYTSCRSALSLHDVARVLGCSAAAATVAGIADFQPDLVMGTGTCGALDGNLIVNGIISAVSCLEYDISGSGSSSRWPLARSSSRGVQ